MTIEVQRTDQFRNAIIALLSRQSYTMSSGGHGEHLGVHTHVARVDLDVQWVTDALTLLLRLELERLGG